MKMKIESEVIVPGVGKVRHTHEQEFEDNSNVFGLVSDYREYMKKLFPGCEFKALKVKRV